MTAPAARPRAAAGGLGSLARAAVLIGVLTALARVAGVGRWFVFSASVGAGCTGTAYAAANTLPNVVFEVAAGGALAGAVVPVLAGLLATGRRADADRTASALLTWVVVVLLPISLLLVAVAGPLGRLAVGGSSGSAAQQCADPAALADLAARMISMFAPQVVLYGVGIVLTGVLQSHRRFAGPAVAPLLSSLVVIGAYVLFGALTGGAATLPDRQAELVLSLGTTLGVAALSLPLFVPVLAAGVRLRPTLAFPPGVPGRLRGLALAGLGALLAQQAAVLVTIALANRVGGAGALVVVQYAQAVYLLPYAVLAVPVATATFPRLSAQVAQERPDEFAATVARGIRVVLAVSLLGTAMLAAAAPAVQALFVALDVAMDVTTAAGTGGALTTLAAGLTCFAAGLAGWGLVAHLSRALYALGRGRAASAATAGGWLVVVAASTVAVLGLRAAGTPGERAAVLGLAVGTSTGMLLAGGLLLRALRVGAGATATDGAGRALLVGSGAALAGGLAGRAVADLLLTSGNRGLGAAAVATGVGLLAGLVASLAFAAVAWLAEPGPDALAPAARPRVALVLATSGGGVGRHVAALARWLTDAGVPVRIAGPAATDAAFGFEATRAAFEPVEIADRPRPTADVRALLRLRGLAGRVDVVHAHGLRAGALAVLAGRSRRRRARIVVTLHNALVGDGRVAAVHHLLARVVARGADAVLVVSSDLGARMRALGARQVDRALVPAPPRTPTADRPRPGPRSASTPTSGCW